VATSNGSERVDEAVWAPEHVVAMAPDRAAVAAARALALPGRWSATGADDEAVWGVCRGSGAEPYQVAVELAEPAFRCSCPSRKLPCKHVLALLLLWVNGHVPALTRPGVVANWLAARAARAATAAARQTTVVEPTDAEDDVASRRTDRQPSTAGPPSPAPGPDKRALERAARVAAGLGELDRWVCDRVRTGLTDPALATYAPWDQVAARLVDAQAPALANRVRRLAGVVGTRAGWHEHVLAELGALHALAIAGCHLPALAECRPALADSVRTAVGWQLRQADVLAQPPITDHWHVVGRSDTLEDRIVVRRTWLRGRSTRRWALLLSFAAYGQSLGGEPEPGTIIHADVHAYPGAAPLRVLLGLIHAPATVDVDGPPSASLAGACDDVGVALAAEPWLERHPLTVRAWPTLVDGRWVLADHTGSMPITGNLDGVPLLVACTAGHSATISAEWMPDGVVPLTVHLVDGAVDIGPRGGWS